MMEKAKEVKCSEFGDAVIEWMDDKPKGTKGKKGNGGKKKVAKKVVKKAKKKNKK
jgi:hypothetical protein